MSWDDLVAQGPGDDVLSAIDALTQRPGGVVTDYLDRCQAKPMDDRSVTAT